MKKHLPEHASHAPSTISGKKSSFKRTQFMNDLTHAGKESFSHIKSEAKYGLKSRKQLMNPELAWGGPYKIPESIKLPKFVSTIEKMDPVHQSKPSLEQEIKMRSQKMYHTASRNLNDFHTYTGEFQHRAPSGYGILVFENGEAYRGQWSNGIMHGEGVFITRNGNGFCGNFRNGKPDGKGEIWIWDWLNSTVLETVNGEWINGKWHTY